MRKFLIAIISIAAFSFATEECNNGSYQIQAPLGSCVNQGYVCQVTTLSTGGIQFFLGATADCSSFETTDAFVTYPLKGVNELDQSKPNHTLMPYLAEYNDPDPQKSVGALAVATNTAFIINAANEKFKVLITYYQIANQYDASSVRLQSIQKVPQ